MNRTPALTLAEDALLEAALDRSLEDLDRAALHKLRVEAIAYTREIILGYAYRLLDGGQFAAIASEIFDDILAITRSHPFYLP